MKEIKAMEAFGTPYMTQAEDLSIEQRGYWTRVLGKNVTIENYRGATIEEREKWQEELDQLSIINFEEYGKDSRIK